MEDKRDLTEIENKYIKPAFGMKTCADHIKERRSKFDYPRKEKKKQLRDVPEMQLIARRYKEQFESKWPKETVYWYQKEWKQAKMFLTKIGDVKKALRIIDVIFNGWTFYKDQWKITSPAPTMGIILGFGVQLSPEISVDDKATGDKPWTKFAL